MADMTIKVKHCTLPRECPASCEYLREVQEITTADILTFCDEPANGGCPYVKIMEQVILGPYVEDMQAI